MALKFHVEIRCAEPLVKGCPANDPVRPRKLQMTLADDGTLTHAPLPHGWTANGAGTVKCPTHSR